MRIRVSIRSSTMEDNKQTSYKEYTIITWTHNTDSIHIRGISMLVSREPWPAGVTGQQCVCVFVSQPAAAGHTELIVKLPPPPSPLPEWRCNERPPHRSADRFVSKWQRLCPDELTPQEEQSANCPVCTCCHRVHRVCAERLLDVSRCGWSAPGELQ